MEDAQDSGIHNKALKRAIDQEKAMNPEKTTDSE